MDNAGSLFILLCFPFVAKAEVEVERLDQLKASRMKEIAFKRQAELEEIFARAHIEIDPEAARAKIMSLIDSGDVEPSELLADMDNQITKAKEEAFSRKDILDKVEKWMSACEEESWLEDYNRVSSLSLSPPPSLDSLWIRSTLIRNAHLCSLQCCCTPIQAISLTANRALSASMWSCNLLVCPNPELIVYHAF